MKKILALAVAAAMVASLATMAAATPIDVDTEGVVVFLFEDLDDVPDPGPFCPVEGGPDPGPCDCCGDDDDGGWEGAFEFLNAFGSNHLDFGHREMPALGAVSIEALTNDARDTLTTDDPRTRAARVLGMGIQAWIADTTVDPPVMKDGTWELTVALNNFIDDSSGDETLDGFTIALAVGSANPPASHQTGVTPNVLTPTLTQPGAGALVDFPAADGIAGAVFGWEWYATLAGTATASNMPAPGAEAEAYLHWTYTPTPAP